MSGVNIKFANATYGSVSTLIKRYLEKMKCHNCQFTDNKVIESRDVADGEAIRRRRQCLKCGLSLYHL
jgi:hypothetical protein